MEGFAAQEEILESGASLRIGHITDHCCACELFVFLSDGWHRLLKHTQPQVQSRVAELNCLICLGSAALPLVADACNALPQSCTP